MDDSPKAPIADSYKAAGGYSDHRSGKPFMVEVYIKKD
jgi:hypothetical protein